MALDTTPGGASADSYASLVEMNAYHTAHLYSEAWTAASDSDKEAGGIMMTRLLDGMPRAWTGLASTSTQALGWPRKGMLTRNGYGIANNKIPQALKNAEAEGARQLIEENLLETDSVTAKGITSLKAGPVALTFKKTRDIQDALLAMIPDAVISLLVPSWLIEIADLDDGDRTGLVIEVL